MEVRGERGCFMEAMRAIFNTIRDRLRPRRARQRTKNYRICRNSAMAMTKSEKKIDPKKHLSSGLNTRLTKRNHSAETANVDTAGRRMQEDGELKERLKSSLRAVQVKRKPHWVLQRAWGQNKMEDTQAEEDLQPTEPASEKANMEDTLLEENLQPAEPASEKAKMEDLQPTEPASWVVAYGQMWQEITEQDGPVLCSNMPIIYSGSGSSYHFPAEWALDQLMEEQRSSENKDGPVSERANMEETEAGEDVQPGEPASWVVAYGQMLQEITEQDGPVLCSNMPIIYW
ncbi:uncharacterized protein LOC121681592 isoform X3 [Alosa sapidissima]|uniref:uncharacterized protein LOC121681592 isoform X2 n=1 Tax=Alosa sapidissima TaxID=34773 RepID=UPI001C09DB64|nr:uncharacterized protein LOC121681592 isoform X2 [Alosa sapidissima]XP_041917345.1 uncharacterized protein LOC121681592 isoform X3 [Alosa sapidissima]